MQTRFLYVCRHAKSEHPDNLSDHERPLNSRGRSNARVMGYMLSKIQSIPEHVVCSPSVRTRETLDIMSKQFDPVPTVDYCEGVYLASEQELYRCIQNHGSGERLMVVGHNPGMAMFATSLCEAPEFAMPFSYRRDCLHRVGNRELDRYLFRLRSVMLVSYTRV